MSDDVERRAQHWRRAQLAAVCDVVEPWEHGTVMRATRYPSYYDFNVVLVDGDPGMSAEELVAVADERLAGLEHRRLDFELVEAGDRVRGDLEAGQFEATRLLWMRHSGSLPPGPGLEVEEVDYDAIIGLRRAWHSEDFPEVATGDYIANSREVSMTRGVQVIATRDGDELVGYAQLERSGAAAEITQCSCFRSTVAPGAARQSPERRSRPPATSTTSGSSPTTRTGRRSSTPGSASVPLGPRSSSCARRASPAGRAQR